MPKTCINQLISYSRHFSILISPWDEYEKKYRRLFKSKIENVAKPFRMALGSLIIQQKYQYSDRELVEQITENPYLQYFIDLPGYQEDPPSASSGGFPEKQETQENSQETFLQTGSQGNKETAFLCSS